MSRAIGALRRVPAAAWACALVAIANGAVWALITPPFHVPDEPQHAAYAQTLAERGDIPPLEGRPVFSSEEGAAFNGVGFNSVVGNARARPPWTATAAASLDADLAADPAGDDGGGPSNATNYSPFYYAGAAIAFRASPSDNFLDRLLAMRLFSALLAGVTILCVFLFLRELLPSTPWAWTVGALAAAVQPIFGFLSGGVNNDNLIVTFAAAAFLVLARAFRRGLTVRRGIALGVVVALGVVAKQSMAGLVPGIAFGVLALVWRAEPEDRPAVMRAAVAAMLAAVIPGIAYLFVNAVVLDRPLLAGAETVGSGANRSSGSVREQLSYIWQLYLPRLPFMTDQFTDGFPLDTLWFRGGIGRFGWLDFGFPGWVYSLAAGVWAVLGALAVSGIVRARAALSRRWPEVLAYGLMAAGPLVLIGAVAYRYRLDTGFQFEQARYLLPLLSVYAAVVALAARGAGRRWGPAVGGVIVVLALAHGLFSQLLLMSRYYG